MSRLRDELRADPVCRRDRLIDREIWQSSRLAHRLSLRELTVPEIDRRLAQRPEHTVDVCQYVVPIYPERRHG
jgi:hypothetical protein